MSKEIQKPTPTCEGHEKRGGVNPPPKNPKPNFKPPAQKKS
jgi:hypothetical protein